MRLHAERNSILAGDKQKLEGTMKSRMIQLDLNFRACIKKTEETVSKRKRKQEN